MERTVSPGHQDFPQLITNNYFYLPLSHSSIVSLHNGWLKDKQSYGFSVPIPISLKKFFCCSSDENPAGSRPFLTVSCLSSAFMSVIYLLLPTCRLPQRKGFLRNKLISIRLFAILLHSTYFI